jgi:hypothetical protein
LELQSAGVLISRRKERARPPELAIAAIIARHSLEFAFSHSDTHILSFPAATGQGREFSIAGGKTTWLSSLEKFTGASILSLGDAAAAVQVAVLGWPEGVRISSALCAKKQNCITAQHRAAKSCPEAAAGGPGSDWVLHAAHAGSNFVHQHNARLPGSSETHEGQMTVKHLAWYQDVQGVGWIIMASQHARAQRAIAALSEPPCPGSLPCECSSCRLHRALSCSEWDAASTRTHCG